MIPSDLTGAARTPLVRAAAPGELDAIRVLLAAHALPTADLDPARPPRFWVAHDGTRVVAAIGLEPYGESGLLRSLVVAAELRVRGLGSRLVETVETAARTAGLVRLILLTETAAAFFARRGYAGIDRAVAPAEVRASAEFRSLCPASAQCMAKTLV